MNPAYDLVAATDIGRIRATNEDCLQILPALDLAVIADGMGGHRAGDIASRMAVETVCDYFAEQAPVSGEAADHGPIRDRMAEALSRANSRVYASACQRPEWRGMGTTLLAVSFQPGNLQVGHIGDSRLYGFRNGELIQLTTDHTLATELKSANPDREPPAYSHHLLQKALGINVGCQPDFLSLAPQEYGIYLLCTDGLSGVLSDREIAAILVQHAPQPEQCAQAMIAACLDRGAPDNLSLVLALASETA